MLFFHSLSLRFGFALLCVCVFADCFHWTLFANCNRIMFVFLFNLFLMFVAVHMFIYIYVRWHFTNGFHENPHIRLEHKLHRNPKNPPKSTHRQFISNTLCVVVGLFYALFDAKQTCLFVCKLCLNSELPLKNKLSCLFDRCFFSSFFFLFWHEHSPKN